MRNEENGKEAIAMKHLFEKGILARENLFAIGFLFVYALILLAADPEWLLWAGPITLGAFPVEAPAVSPAFRPMESLQAASYAVLPGLLALILLLRTRGEGRASRTSEVSRATAAHGNAAVRVEPEHRKAA